MVHSKIRIKSKCNKIKLVLLNEKYENRFFGLRHDELIEQEKKKSTTHSQPKNKA